MRITDNSDAASNAEDTAIMHDYLGTLPALDWSDLDLVHAQTEPILKAIAADRDALRTLIANARMQPRLLEMCERHYLLDYFVLYDAPDRNFRMRIHLHTTNHLERPHNHRFPFTTFVICGSYSHLIQRVRSGVAAVTKFEDMELAYRTREQAGSCYTISPNTIHTTYTEPDTISIIIRGPAVLDKSIIIDRETGGVTWRVGRNSETSERREQVKMSLADFDELTKKLARLGVI